MPSQRRMRVTGLVVVLVIVVILYMTTSASRTRNSPFYVKTQEALQAKEYSEATKKHEATKQHDADDARARLKVAEEAAKKSADEKHQKYLESVSGGGVETKGKSVGGGKFKVQLPDDDEMKKNVPGVATVGGKPRDKEAAKESESQEDHEIETELNGILKKSPIIIFSKSYCPHSAKAKHILLEKYNIVPAPYVVELDQHPLGLKLQETLADKTGRRTVPNVLVLGKSIGGGSEMQELDNTDKLMDTVRGMGGSRVSEVSRKDPHKDMRNKRVVRD